ncbi:MULTISPECIES: AraC family transcriptional regulator [Paenibacillus]|uniref:AraC family transcriptional regulator n=1 Tax=Paenibacillus naphthalenovorans TaxID=162209 RepID=A0A0U2UD83_9BACL|nr:MULTISPECIES: AraC family transcriptional regulator [Paenibacillus]ALS24232.1 AraC family transcriptional regulator [Paenibacillus naphthalenovorans]GCL73877.1 AraC family transcriptional regulator [Paenibacillus naphthalenovorans]SDI50761.1 AraC-type DNA-binding protein [Paenibacillus naphthalenovorans]
MLTPGELASRLNKLVISILIVGHRKCETDWYQKAQPIKHHSVWLIIKGKGTFTINGTHYPAEPGKLFWFAPGMVVERTTDPEHPLEYYFIRFHYTECYEDKEQWVYNNASETRFPLEGMYTVTNTPQLIYLFEQLDVLWKRRGHMTAMRRKILLQELLLTLVTDFRAQKIAGDTTAAIELTQDYMIGHYQEPLTLEGLAQMAGLSVSHYSRLFKKYIGYSPIDYLTHLRVDRAKELLVLSDYRLKSIASSVGYTDEFYFSRIFKKVTGVSPREYAKNHRITSGN